MLWPLYPQERTPVLVEVEAGWASELIWKYLGRENFLLLPGFESWIVQLVA
jgi:hypothetical protein